jgi:FtsP/CotA-like multicopper oxidase with cupredoxin domain
MSNRNQEHAALRRVRVLCALVFGCLGLGAHAAAPGIVGPTFSLVAQEAHITQPDGQSVYSWGYGCATGTTPVFAPAQIAGAKCPTMQIPGPTLIVTQGQTVTVTLTNNLPAAAGNTSILFPGFQVTGTGGSPGLLAQEAPHGGTVTYTFTATTPGTRAYYSGTQGDLQVEMGLYGAIIVLPSALPANCVSTKNDSARTAGNEGDFRLAAAAYNHPSACYDREYLFQFSEIDPVIHRAAEEQATLSCTLPNGCMNVPTEPYHPAYFMINGRSMPDDMDPNYAPQYPHQPYNGNPHMHPGELVLLRVLGTGRWQHPFHEHGNHVRVLARDGNLLLSQTNPSQNLAGPLLFTTTTTPGLAMDGIFYWTGQGLNWDAYGHATTGAAAVYNLDPSDPRYAAYNGKPVVCIPDANGYYTADPAAPNYFEWCGDHNKPLESKPFGSVGAGGPVTLPDANILTNGAWFGGSAYLGPDATTRAIGPTSTTPPSGTIANPSSEAGFAFMWHSHNEREITTNNIFPGGMMMMMLVDPRAFAIDESN